MYCSVGFSGPAVKHLSFALGKTVQPAQFYIILVHFFFQSAPLPNHCWIFVSDTDPILMGEFPTTV